MTNTTHDDDGTPRHNTFLDHFMTSLTRQEQKQHIIHQYQRLTDRLSRRLQHGQDAQHGFSQVIAQRHDQCNRYCDIIPYDYNRVTLSDNNLGPSDHDYINASWIQFKRKKYIATQGPLPSTCGDFWRMVLEQHVKVIVCLTPEIENGRSKCAAYWPPPPKDDDDDDDDDGIVRFELHQDDIPQRQQRRRSFGHHFLFNKSSTSSTTQQHTWTIQIKHIAPISIDQEAACRIRTLEVTCDRGNERMASTIVYQLEFMGWADHGVPQQTHTLNALIQLANQYQQQQQQDGPMVVHCSAGCGRTGTFCVIDTALEYITTEPFNNDDDDDDPIYQITDLFRQQRTTMVQTPAQYFFCYHAIWDQLQKQLE